MLLVQTVTASILAHITDIIVAELPLRIAMLSIVFMSSFFSVGFAVTLGVAFAPLNIKSCSAWAYCQQKHHAHIASLICLCVADCIPVLTRHILQHVNLVPFLLKSLSLVRQVTVISPMITVKSGRPFLDRIY